jgi:hypothetical protein
MTHNLPETFSHPGGHMKSVVAAGLALSLAAAPIQARADCGQIAAGILVL